MSKPILHALSVALFLGAGATINGYSRFADGKPHEFALQLSLMGKQLVNMHLYTIQVRDPVAAWQNANALDSLVGWVALLGMGIARRLK